MRILIIAALLALCAVTGCGDRPLTVTAECKSYVACFEATGGTRGSLDTTYGDKGSCWMSTDSAADSCTAACKAALASLKTANPDAGCM